MAIFKSLFARDLFNEQKYETDYVCKLTLLERNCNDFHCWQIANDVL